MPIKEKDSMAKPYRPYEKNPKLIELMNRAHKTNAERSAEESKTAGVAALEDTPIDERVRTAMTAIVAGLNTLEIDKEAALDCIAEGLAMIEDVELKLRTGKVGIPLSGSN